MTPSSFPPNSFVAGQPERQWPDRWPIAGVVLGGRYRLLEPLGQGGMSVIWRAVDRELDRAVAIKIPRAGHDVPVDRDVLARNEARAVAAVSHPDVVVVHDVGEATAPDGTTVTFLVLQMLTGDSLLDLLAAGPLEWRRAADIAARLASVLAAVHAHGVVHRDVTPDNVMVTENEVKLLDFGIAARIGDRPQPSWTFGTPAYLAPERLAGVLADPAADVFSLGALLVEMLTGRPWDGFLRIPAGVPFELVRICDRCLGREPGSRPSVAEVAADLTALGGTALALPPAPGIAGVSADPTASAATRVLARAATRGRRRRAAMFAAIAAALVPAVVIAVMVLLEPLTAPRPQAEGAPAVTGPPSPRPAWTVPASGGPRATQRPRGTSPARPTRTAATAASPPTTSASSAAAPLTLAAAAEQVRSVLGRHAAEGTVTPQAVQKIDAQISNVVSNQGARPENLAVLVSDLRRSVADELRDGGISPAAGADLYAAVDRVCATVRECSSAAR